jgi:hypothetical protein
MKKTSPKLNFEIVKLIDDSSWSEFVQNVYGKPYCFQQQDGCRSRGVYLLEVPDNQAEDFESGGENEDEDGELMGTSLESWLARDPKEPLEGQEYDWQLTNWWEKNFYPTIEILANDLHSKGLLEEGEYIINVNW